MENEMMQAIDALSDVVHGNYNDIIGFIGLSCFAAFVIYFISDLRQAGRRGRNTRLGR